MKKNLKDIIEFVIIFGMTFSLSYILIGTIGAFMNGDFAK